MKLPNQFDPRPPSPGEEPATNGISRKGLTTFQRQLGGLKLTALAFCSLAGVAVGQTNPTPQSLPLSQDFGTTTFTTLPTGFAAWNGVSGAAVTTQLLAEASAPTGNATIATAAAATTTGGFFGFSAASNGKAYTQTSSNTTNGVNQLVMAVSSTSRQDLVVSYDVESISAQPRTIGVVCQYRIGTSGAWTTVVPTSGSNPYSQAGGTTGLKTTVSATLPASANDQPVVQVRWAYWRGTDAGGSSGLAIDNVTVTSSPLTGDSNPPTISTLLPANASVNVPVDSNLVLTFNETVVPLTGSITLKKTVGESTVQTFAVPTDITHSGAIVTLDPTADLELGVSYYLEMTADSFEDAAGNNFGGVSGTTTWSFTTLPPDTTDPSITAITPTTGATGIALKPSILLTFSELIAPTPTGIILIKKTADDSTVASFDINNPLQVSIFNDQVTLIVTTALPHNTSLYVDVPTGTFLDVSPNENPSVAFTSAFTTVDVPVLLATPAYTQGFTGFSAAAPTLPLGWSLTGADVAFDVVGHRIWGEGFNSGLRGDANLLGYQHTGSTGSVVKTLTLVNGTGDTLSALTVGYTGKAERTIEARSPAYTVSVAGSLATSLGYSTSSPDGTVLSASVSGLSIPAGATFEITWTSDRGTGSGASKQIGLTGVSISAGATLLTPSIAGPNLVLETLTSTAADITADVTADGGSAITQRGFVYSLTATNATPQIGGTGVTQVIDPTTALDQMTASLSGLVSSSGYSISAYAINSVGTSYTPVLTFTTLAPPPSFVTSYSQGFDNFIGALPAGWTAISGGGVNGYAGAWGPSTSAGGLVGGVSNQGVLGYQHVATSGTLTVTLSLMNDTGTTLSQLYVGYLGRVSRATEARHPAWDVTVGGVSAGALAFSTGSGLDEAKGAMISGLSILPGEVFTITWVSDRGNNVANGSSRQIGIEDVIVALEPPAISDFDTWAGQTGATGGMTGDTDLDGRDNAFEYAFGLNPTSGGSVTPFTSVLNKTTGEFTFTRRNPLLTGLTYTYEYHTTLTGAWTPFTPAVTPVTSGSPVETVTVTVPAALLTEPKLFIRIVTP